eukprot:s6201_g8.t1
MPAASEEWSGVAELDPLLAERVEKHFCRLGDFLLSIADEDDALQMVKGCMEDVRSSTACRELAGKLDFLLSIADEDDALQMVKGCMEDVRSSTACRELAGKLWQFSQKHAGAADRVVRGVVRAATCGPYRPPTLKEAPEDVYLKAVNASPHLGLAVLEKAIKAKRATAGRAEHEEAKRKKWALLLAGCIEEAGLPAVERVGQVPLESRLSKDSLLEGLRFACFMVLIMIWGCLRCDDLQGISPESITLSQLGLKFTLSRTKTSGPGKRVGQLQGFVLRSISLSGYDWLAAGVNLLQTDDFKIPRDFLFLRLTDGWEVHSREFMDGEGVACHIRRTLAELRAPPRDFLFLRLTDGWEVHSREFMDGEGVACHIRRTLAELRAPRFQEGTWGLSKTVRLVPEALLGFWSGHSARHFLPSVAAATGVDSDKRDFLGRWAVARSAGQAYVLTARQVIHAIQAHVCAALLEGRPVPGYV